MARIDEAQIRNRARSGATLLDTLVPGWYRRLDLSRLSIMDMDQCILGQLFDDSYATALHELDLNDTAEVMHGFCLYAAECSWWEELLEFLLGRRSQAYRILEAAWAIEVNSRLADDQRAKVPATVNASAILADRSLS